jgi:restriction system protein
MIVPVVKAVAALGGSAQSAQIIDQVLADSAPTDEMLAVTFPNRPHHSVLIDRIMWGRSYAKLIGALESPKRAVFLLTALGRELIALPEAEAVARAKELDREFRRNRPQRAKTAAVNAPEDAPAGDLSPELGEDPAVVEGAVEDDTRWQDVLLDRLHQLSPDGFENFVLYLLRLYDMELRRVGGSNDGGIDGIGTAPISPVLSSRVAVQIKRYDPNGKPVGREVVALFQRDARANGAERAILVTLGRFSEKAREEATAMTPTVDLIDGSRLADLVLEQRLGVELEPVVDTAWFDRF